MSKDKRPLERIYKDTDKQQDASEAAAEKQELAPSTYSIGPNCKRRHNKR